MIFLHYLRDSKSGHRVLRNKKEGNAMLTKIQRIFVILSIATLLSNTIAQEELTDQKIHHAQQHAPTKTSCA